MKRYLLAILLILGLVISCGGSKDITLPNKNVKVEGNVLTFKGKPFSGNIKMNLADKMDGYSGAISFKEGHLDGLTDLKNDKQNQQMKFTVTEGKFDGELIMKDPSQRIDITLDIKNGAIVKYLGDIQGVYKYDLNFVDNLANGTMEVQGQKLEFKDGIAKGPQGQEVKLSLDPASGDMEMEASVNGRVAGKQTIPNVLTPQYLESFLFQAIATTNR
ncbi:hypothetical protein [Sebaldella sp. S0638]|uniref:hypothetical protein n=1 Tax=Sebaldella sp. S0638 TaxID=2957809 RepID=UPI00209E4E74|nr:hypothetical protein [Sebaldella sp. S0638]MCP1225362.1 hypothetical protein [Sebaldella sp. S0638]